MSKIKKEQVQLALFDPFTFVHIDNQFDPLNTQTIEKAINEAPADYVRTAVFHPSTIFTHLAAQKNNAERYQSWTLNSSAFTVTPKRLTAFQQNMKCVCCGREGTLFLAERHVNDNCGQYINLYSITSNGTLVLMTVDHILPDSLGGMYGKNNFQTMCRPCNALKGNSMTDEEINKVLMDPSKYAKNWLDQEFLEELLRLHLLVNTETDRFKYQRLKQILDKHRKAISHTTKQARYKQLAEILRDAVLKVYEVPPPPPSKFSGIVATMVERIKSFFCGTVDKTTLNG
jgi:5-methylcytosine-specific restriction endonuclease McrA